MALIEGFRVQNYRVLKDITLGRLSNTQDATPLTPFTVVIGKNGVGKSSLFDAFGFLSDCIKTDIETAAAQIVEIRETVQEIFIPKYVETERSQPPLFQRCSDADLLSWGVPAEWLPDVRTAT